MATYFSNSYFFSGSNQSQLADGLSDELFQEIPGVPYMTADALCTANTNSRILDEQTALIQEMIIQGKIKLITGSDQESFLEDHKNICKTVRQYMKLNDSITDEISELSSRFKHNIEVLSRKEEPWIEFIYELFSRLAIELNYVSILLEKGKISTYNCVKSSTGKFTIPDKNHPDTCLRKDIINNFHLLFLDIDKNSNSLEILCSDIQNFIGEVSKIKQCWSEKNPRFADFKESAKQLPGQYENYADTALKLFKEAIQNKNDLIEVNKHYTNYFEKTQKHIKSQVFKLSQELDFYEKILEDKLTKNSYPL